MVADGAGDVGVWRHRGFEMFRGLRRRLVASVAAFTGWVSVTLLFLAFWAGRFTLLQDIVVLVVSLVMLLGVLAATWVSFGMGYFEDSD